MSVPKENIVPPGGFHYVEQGTRIESHSYQALADELLKYRLANKIPVGNPLKDVFDTVCTRWPHFCSDAPHPTLSTGEGTVPLASRVTQWMANLYRSARTTAVADNFVSQGEADRRSAVCRQCPQNVEWRMGCSSCVASTKQIGYTYRAGRRAAGEPSLRACNVLEQENATAVWIKAPPTMTTEQARTIPPFCWRKQA